MNKCSNFISMCNPCAEYDYLDQFEFLNTKNKITVCTVTALVTLFTLPLFPLLGVFTFRSLVKKFIAKDLVDGGNPNPILNKSAKKIQKNDVVQELQGQEPQNKLDLLNRRNATPLIYAIVENNIEKAKNLPNEVNIPDSEGFLPLHWAIQEGNLELVEHFVQLASPETINAEIARDISPLSLALKSGNTDILKCLLDHGAKTSVHYNGKEIWLSAAQEGSLEIFKHLINGRTPEEKWQALTYAAEANKIDIATYLLDEGTVPEIPEYGLPLAYDENQEIMIFSNLIIAPLYRAAKQGHLDMVKLLLERNPELLNFKMNDEVFDFTVLSYAAKADKKDIVEYLLQQGANASIPDGNRTLPLHWAAYNGNLDMVKLLLDSKPKTLNSLGNQGSTALMLSARNSKMDVLKYLLDKNANVNIRDELGYLPLHWATQNGHLDTVKLLIDNDLCDVNSTGSPAGATALGIAAMEGKLDIAKYLIEKGADLNIPCNAGYLPLHWAASEGRLDFLKFLIDNNHYEIDLKNRRNATALRVACEKGRTEIVEYLLDKGANAWIAGIDNHIPMIMASYLGHLEIVKLFLDKNPDCIDTKFFKGITLLRAAAEGNKLDTLQYLLANGASPMIGDNDDDLPLHSAAYHGHLNVVKFLRENHPASVNYKNFTQGTPLSAAAKNGKLEIVRYLLQYGANPDLADENGLTPAELAIQNNHHEIANFIDGLPRLDL